MFGQVYLKRYKVLRLLDEGGMSKVYLAQQLDQPREVAVKVLKDGLAAQTKVREHFKREIYIMSRFQHPHTVTLYDADGEAKQPLLVMEYLRGVDLLRLLERNRRLSPERAGRLLGQMCNVLQAAHDDGIVHRDIKPANFMIVHPDTPHEQVKLMDFGLARMSSMLYISPEELCNLRQPTASGTPEYISPEQVRGNEVDRRSDLYSLGVVLFEMLTGRRPFENPSVHELLLAHSDDMPPSFAAVGAGGIVPPAVEAVVQSCLAKYPEERPQSVEELAQRYEEALGRKIYQKPRTQAVPRTNIRPLAAGGNRVEDRLRTLTATNGQGNRNAIVQSLTATMPESMAMLKLKGFIHDLGGEILESIPGMIRVRIGTPEQPRSSGLFRWLGGQTARTIDTINMELLMEKADPAQAGQLSITLKLTSPSGIFNADGRARCERIGRDLQAYLMGR
jgi:eukaryotic-like serine/threonine-protein kinase